MAVLKLHQPIEKMKIGILGFRGDLISCVLDTYRIPYHRLSDQNEITDDFDFVFASGVYYIVKDPYLSAPTYGIFGFHESPLPEGNGHCPIAWTVLNGRKHLTVSLFKMEEQFDTGMIAFQYNMYFDSLDVYSELERKRQTAVTLCFSEFLQELRDGYLVLRHQSGNGSYSRKRTPEDSELDINKTIAEQWDLIRICDNDNFPAFFNISDGETTRKIVLKYEAE